MKTLFPPEQPLPTAKFSNSLLDGHALVPENWRLILLELQNHLDEQTFDKWILPIKAFDRTPRRMSLVVPDVVFYQSLTRNYLSLIEAAKHSLGFHHLKIDVGVIGDPELQGSDNSSDLSNNTPRQALSDFSELTDLNDINDLREISDISDKSDMRCSGDINDLGDGERGEHGAAPHFISTLSRTPKLNPNYTFENFVRGPSNQFALASCLNVAENPGRNYNPLFLYGSTGLGKTHLLHAVGNQVLRHRPECIVTYISSERFMNEMIYCIRHNKMWDFRQKYRHCDVFMMDDIQFISGNKAATQEEFFHTFNTLYEAKKQIIITSDLFPQDIPDIEERLRNRFQWGLIADIQPPDIEHRIAILMNKADKLNVHLSPEVAEYIANHAKRNIRELEGALHRIAAFAALQGRRINKAIAMEIFNSIQSDIPAKQIEIEAIQKAVAEQFKLRISDLKSKKRHRALTLPRQIAMYLSRQHTQASFPEIGEKFGGKDHSTVMHAVKKITADKHKDLDIKAHLDTLERYLEQLQVQ